MRPTRVMGLVGLSVAMFGASANAEIDSEFTMGYDTEYIFRGVDFGDDLFTYALDFSGTTDSGFDWSGGIWYANVSGLGATGADEELDIYGGISKDFGGFGLEFGFIRYIFPDANDSGNTELYLSASTSVSVIDLSATFYYNADSDTLAAIQPGDYYLEFAAAYGFDISECLSGEVGASVALYDIDALGTAPTDDSGLANYSVYASLTKALSDNISLSAYIKAVVNDDDYNPDASGDGEEYLVGGLSTTIAF